MKITNQNLDYRGNDRLLFGIILGVLAFWLFAQTTLNINVEMAKDLGMKQSMMNIAVFITSLFSGIFIVVMGGLSRSDRSGKNGFGGIYFQYNRIIIGCSNTSWKPFNPYFINRKNLSGTIRSMFNACEFGIGKSILGWCCKTARNKFMVYRFLGRCRILCVVWWFSGF